MMPGHGLYDIPHMVAAGRTIKQRRPGASMVYPGRFAGQDIREQRAVLAEIMQQTRQLRPVSHVQRLPVQTGKVGHVQIVFTYRNRMTVVRT